MSNYGYKKKKISPGHIWTTLYIPEILLEWEFLMKNIKTHILFSVTFSENPSVYDSLLKNGIAKETIEDNIIWRMNFAC